MARPFSVRVALKRTIDTNNASCASGSQTEINMANPNLWLLFIGAFAFSGAINLARGLHRTDARRPLSLGLGIAGFLWAASAGLFRFVNRPAGYAAAAIAAITMIGASLAGVRKP